MVNNETFLIEELDIELARDFCRVIEDPEKRAKAVACNTAASIAKKYFQDVEADCESGIHKVAEVVNDIEISDIYLEGSFVDVRVYFNEKELCVPKIHYDLGVLPIAYMFIKLNEDISSGSVVGFIRPSEVDRSADVEGYYPVKEEDLVSYYDIEGYIGSDIEADSEDLKKDILDYLDGKLQDKALFYQKLINSKSARLDLIAADRANHVFKYVSIISDTSSFEESGVEQEVVSEVLKEPDVLTDNVVSEETDVEDLTLDSNAEVLDFDLDTEEDSVEPLTEDLSINDTEDSYLLSEPEDCLVEDDSNSLDLEPNAVAEEFVVVDDEPVLESVADVTYILDEVSDLKEQDVSLNYDAVMEDTENDVTENFDIIESEQLETPEMVNAFEPAEVVIEESNTDVTSDGEVAEDEVKIDISDEVQEPVIDMEYSTSTTPSLDSIIVEDESIKAEDLTPEDLDILENNESNVFDEETKNVNPSEQIEELFVQNDDDVIAESFNTKTNKSGSLLPSLLVLAVIGGLGYYGYTQFLAPKLLPDKPAEPVVKQVDKKVEETSVNKVENVAMPNETVENVKPVINEESTNVSLPQVEQTVDTSIVVSNLVVNWDIPSGYASNNTARRYLTKIGKIIQLDIKAELLLLNKAPITNKISLELEFDKNSNKFVVKRFVESSGDDSIDKSIENIVKTTLNRNFNVNMNAIGNLTGNPILVIRL